jgi:transcriptional regulator with XRE-family HTH domain
MKNFPKMAERIKKARKEAGFTQQEMSEALHVSDKAISSYEVGRATPNVRTLQEISRVTHKPIRYFIEEENDEIVLQVKIKAIEKELEDIKQLLRKRGEAA